MKGVILAGGVGKRLNPLTDPLNKHLLPVYNKPMIEYAINTLVGGGIDNILILLNGLHPGLFLEMLEDGSRFDCEISYRFSKQLGGPGRTLMLAKKWIAHEDFFVILGDGIFFTQLPLMEIEAPHMFISPLNSFDDPHKYGQVKIENNLVKSIVWKPNNIFSNLIQTTCFKFPPDVFSRLDKIDKDIKGEINITTITTQYVQEGKMKYTILPEFSYIDCGTFEALHTASKKAKENFVARL
ncbi:MAG: sugar phosphate nucleotidyltransferase [Patescibacteria group bacterium]|nr:sugar phosphate nucleotidyltransferase [Patescibacteria group bacterium]